MSCVLHTGETEMLLMNTSFLRCGEDFEKKATVISPPTHTHIENIRALSEVSADMEKAILWVFNNLSYPFKTHITPLTFTLPEQNLLK